MSFKIVFQDVTEPDQGIPVSDIDLGRVYPLVNQSQRLKNVSFKHDPAARSLPHE